MNTAIIYKDINGEERTIHQMVKYEPEWAANRIQAGEDALNSLQQLKAEIAAIKKCAENRRKFTTLDDSFILTEVLRQLPAV